MKDVDISVLEKPRRTAKGITARCPACAQNGEDNAGTNLFIGDRGFCCIKYKDDKEHRKIISSFLRGKGVEVSFDSYAAEEKIVIPKKWDKSLLEKLSPFDEYWNNRGISSKTLRHFRAGYVGKSKIENASRYVFPIFSFHNEIVGWAGRYVGSLKEDELKQLGMPKWKLTGDKAYWIYPHNNREDIISAKSVLLVEGISDIIYLHEHGYKNCLSLFGTSLMKGLLKFLISLPNVKIVIALNNEESGVGNKSAEKIKEMLLTFFDEGRIIIKLPPKKDFALLSKEELNNYFNELRDIER